MPVVPDSVEVTSDSPFTFDITVAFTLTEQGQPRKELISEIKTQPGHSPVNASMSGLPHTTHDSGSRRLAKSYLVRNVQLGLGSSSVIGKVIPPGNQTSSMTAINMNVQSRSPRCGFHMLTWSPG